MDVRRGNYELVQPHFAALPVGKIPSKEGVESPVMPQDFPVAKLVDDDVIDALTGDHNEIGV